MITEEDLIKLKRVNEEDNTNNKKIYKIMNYIVKMNVRKNELLVDLEGSMIIKSLWPEAFDGDSLSMRIDSPMGVRNTTKNVRFIMRRLPDGEEKRFDILDIPKVLFLHTLNKNCPLEDKQKGWISRHYYQNYKEEKHE